jgi:hypothetical protein
MLLGVSLHHTAAFADGPSQIGVYYYPGWKVSGGDAVYERGWEPIKTYPEREPLLGWYPEGEVSVAQKQIEWMHQYGIDFIVYDWYWSPDNHVRLDHALNAYLKAPNRNLEKFSLLWANHSEVPKSADQFAAIVKFWIANYFKSEQYLSLSGKPVVFVFSVTRLRQDAERFGKATRDLLETARTLARKEGLPGIYFVGGIQNDSPELEKYAAESGYDAISTYNYGAGQYTSAPSHSYAELDADYRDHWSWTLHHSTLPYFVPMTAGWSRKPWGGSGDPRHDDSISSPEKFEQHLRAAKQIMEANPEKTLRLGVICCWNEFGEGSYIEPTKSWSFSYLEAVKRVFSRSDR